MAGHDSDPGGLISAATVITVNLVSSAGHAHTGITALSTTRAGAASFRRVLLRGRSREHQEKP
jgi:hypothetical protein